MTKTAPQKNRGLLL